MAEEQLVKRTIWVAKCPKCGDQSELTEKTKRERFCQNCRIWIPYEEKSYTGPAQIGK